MQISLSDILQISAVCGVLGSMGVLVRKIVQWLERQKRQDIEIQNIQREQCVMCYALLATLDGLKQVGANGNVTDAYNKLEKHINKQAHDWGE